MTILSSRKYTSSSIEKGAEQRGYNGQRSSNQVFNHCVEESSCRGDTSWPQSIVERTEFRGGALASACRIVRVMNDRSIDRWLALRTQKIDASAAGVRTLAQVSPLLQEPGALR